MADQFVVKDSGERHEFASGMRRDIADGKVRYDLVYSGPMLARWAAQLGKGAIKYGPDNWLNADGPEELARFRESAARHFAQWMNGEVDEDHAAAVFFNINGFEYVRQRMQNSVPVSERSIRDPLSQGDAQMGRMFTLIGGEASLATATPETRDKVRAEGAKLARNMLGRMIRREVTMEEFDAELNRGLTELLRKNVPGISPEVFTVEAESQEEAAAKVNQILDERARKSHIVEASQIASSLDVVGLGGQPKSKPTSDRAGCHAFAWLENLAERGVTWIELLGELEKKKNGTALELTAAAIVEPFVHAWPMLMQAYASMNTGASEDGQIGINALVNILHDLWHTEYPSAVSVTAKSGATRAVLLAVSHPNGVTVRFGNVDMNGIHGENIDRQVALKTWPRYAAILKEADAITDEEASWKCRSELLASWAREPGDDSATIHIPGIALGKP